MVLFTNCYDYLLIVMIIYSFIWLLFTNLYNFLLIRMIIYSIIILFTN